MGGRGVGGEGGRWGGGEVGVATFTILVYNLHTLGPSTSLVTMTIVGS